jgi:hydrogenase/urease accessory protein HupE
LGLEPSRLFGILLGVLAGFAAGAAAQLDVVAVSACLGVAVAMISLSLWGIEAFIHTRRFVPLARRVIGAWMAAIALLLGALALRTLFTTHRG